MVKRSILIISIFGLIISFYLFYEKMLGGQLICGISNCNVVNNSVYSEIYGIPVSFLGVLYYLVIIFLVSFKNDFKLLRLFTTFGVIFSLYLSYLEQFVIHAWCQWCIFSALCVIAQFILSFKLRPKDL